MRRNWSFSVKSFRYSCAQVDLNKIRGPKQFAQSGTMHPHKTLPNTTSICGQTTNLAVPVFFLLLWRKCGAIQEHEVHGIGRSNKSTLLSVSFCEKKGVHNLLRSGLRTLDQVSEHHQKEAENPDFRCLISFTERLDEGLWITSVLKTFLFQILFVYVSFCSFNPGHGSDILHFCRQRRSVTSQEATSRRL